MTEPTLDPKKKGIPNDYVHYLELCSIRRVEPRFDEQQFTRATDELRSLESMESVDLANTLLKRNSNDLFATLGISVHFRELMKASESKDD